MFDNHPICRLFFSIGLMLSVLLMVAPAWSDKPDLQIRFLDIGPTDPNPPLTDRLTSFYALVVNEGQQAIKGPLSVAFELDGKPVKTWQFPSKNKVKDSGPGTQNTIPPGKSCLYQYAATLAPGKHTVHWIVNTADKKNELKATVEAQLSPDLVVTIWPTGDNVLAYQETEWNVEVKNIGGGKAYGPFVTLFNSVPTSGPVAPLEFPKGKYLDKEETYVFKVNQVCNSLDPVIVTATVDYYGEVTEALSFGDDNNSVEKKYAPQYVDLEVSALEIKPAQLTTADPIEVSFTIQNKGNMDAGKPFNVGILVKDVSSGVTKIIDALEANPLPAGTSEQLTKKINLSKAGIYGVQIIADASVIGPNPIIIGKQYNEPDEANNSKEEKFTVSPAVPITQAVVVPNEPPCTPAKGIVKLYRIVSDCATGSIQPYTGFIPPIKNGSLKSIANTTTQWKIKIADSFNLKGIGGGALCEKYGDHCWNLLPAAVLGPGNSWSNIVLTSLNSGKSINACLEALTNDPFPLEVEIEYEYECIKQP
jgi:hypothetical protein